MGGGGRGLVGLGREVVAHVGEGVAVVAHVGEGEK